MCEWLNENRNPKREKILEREETGQIEREGESDFVDDRLSPANEQELEKETVCEQLDCPSLMLRIAAKSYLHSVAFIFYFIFILVGVFVSSNPII